MMDSFVEKDRKINGQIKSRQTDRQTDNDYINSYLKKEINQAP